MRSTTTRRLATGALATVLGVTLALPAPAAETTKTEHPEFYQGVSDASTLQLVVGLPGQIIEPLSDALAPVLEGLGITLADNKLTIDLSLATADINRLVKADALGVAEALPLGGSLQGLIESLTGPLACLDSPIDIAIPDENVPLVSLKLLQANCDDDPTDGIVSSTTKVADLKVDLKGLLALLPAELAETVDGALETLENDLLTPVIGGVNDLLGQVGDALEPIVGQPLQIDDIITVPDFINESFGLLEIGLIEATTTSVFNGEFVTSQSSTTVAGIRLLEMICVVTDNATEGTTFVAETLANGESTDWDTTVPAITLGVCGDEDSLARSILQLTDVGGVLGDILVNVTGENLSLIELLEDSPIPLSDLLEQVDGLLAQLGIGTVLAGSTELIEQTDDFVSVAVRPAAITVDPLNGALDGTPLEGLGIDLFVGANQSTSFAALGEVSNVTPPQPEPEEPNLPKTGGGVIALVLGSLAIGGSALLRRR